MSEFNEIEKLLTRELDGISPSEALEPKKVIRKLRRKKILGYARNIAASFLVIAASVALYISYRPAGDDSYLLEGAQERGSFENGQVENDFGGAPLSFSLNDEIADDFNLDQEIETDGEDYTESPTTNIEYKTKCYHEDGVLMNGDYVFDSNGDYVVDFFASDVENLYVATDDGFGVSIYRTDEMLQTKVKLIDIGDARYSFFYKEGDNLIISVISKEEQLAKQGFEFVSVDSSEEVLGNITLNLISSEVTDVEISKISTEVFDE